MGIEVSDTGLVTYTDVHQSRVDTEVANNPQLCYTARGLPVWSIFRRMVTSSPMHGDGNPLIYALKSKKGYSITAQEICKFRPVFNGIVDKTVDGRHHIVFVPVPSSHNVVSYFARRVSRRIANSTVMDGIFVKKTAGEVLGDLQQVLFPKSIKRDGLALLRSLERSKGKTFSMKDVAQSKLRAYINPLKLVGGLPPIGSKIIIVDDLISTGTTFDSAFALFKQAGVVADVSGLSLLSKL